MLIVCPKCFAQYEIPDALLDKKKNGKGVRFHCSACRSYFVERIDHPMAEQPTEELQQEPSRKEMPQGRADIHSIRADVPLSEAEGKNTGPETAPEDRVDPDISAFGRPFSPNAISIDSDLIPEEFKPVHSSKKNNILAVLIYLIIVSVCCYFAFVKSDWIVQQLSFGDETNSIQTNNSNKGTEIISPKSNSPFQENLTEKQNKTTQITNQNQPIISPKTEIIKEKPQPQNISRLPEEVNAKIPNKDVSSSQKVSGLLMEKEKKTDPNPSVASSPREAYSSESERVSKNDSAFKDNVAPDKRAEVSEEEPVNVKKNQNETGAAALIASLSAVPSDETVIDPFQDMGEAQSVNTFEHKDLPLNQNIHSENPVNNEIKADFVFDGDQPLPAIPRQGIPMSEALKNKSDLAPKEADSLINNLRIQDVSYRIEETETGSKVLLQGVVANTGLTDRSAPELVAYLYDQNGTVLSSKNIILTDPIIQSNEVQSFYSTLVSPRGVDHVRIRFLGESGD